MATPPFPFPSPSTVHVVYECPLAENAKDLFYQQIEVERQMVVLPLCNFSTGSYIELTFQLLSMFTLLNALSFDSFELEKATIIKHLQNVSLVSPIWTSYLHRHTKRHTFMWGVGGHTREMISSLRACQIDKFEIPRYSTWESNPLCPLGGLWLQTEENMISVKGKSGLCTN